MVALEITDKSENIYSYDVPEKLAVIVGSEAHGISPKVLDKCDSAVFIPMLGKGSSLNVAVSVGIALSHLLKDKTRRSSAGSGTRTRTTIKIWRF